MTDYLEGVFPLRARGPISRPDRGAAILQREADDTARLTREREIAAAVKRRDGRCRWPEAHKCRGLLEATHIVDKSLGGETSLENEVLLCAWIHRRGPESIHGKQLKIEKDTPAGAQGLLSFWRQDGGFDALGQPTYYLIARSTPDGVMERD